MPRFGFTILFFLILGLPFLSLAQPPESTTTPAPASESPASAATSAPAATSEAPVGNYVFKMAAAKKEKIIGRLHFEEENKNVKLEFSATNLQKGSYKLYKIDDCDSFKKTKNKSLSGEEIFSFHTNYGDISDEKNMGVSSVQELKLQNKFFALVKADGKNLTFIACSSAASGD